MGDRLDLFSLIELEVLMNSLTEYIDTLRDIGYMTTDPDELEATMNTAINLGWEVADEYRGRTGPKAEHS